MLENFFQLIILCLLKFQVKDIGEKGEGSNSNNQEFKLNIEPYNYGPPTIIFPQDGYQIVLRQVIHKFDPFDMQQGKLASISKRASFFRD